MSAVQDQYQSKLMTQRAFVETFEPGDYVQLGVWYGEPYGVMDAIHKYCGNVDPLHIGVSIATSPSEYLNLPGVHAFTGFHGPRERLSQAKHKNVFYTPMQFTEAGRLLERGAPMTYLIHRVAPMDERGYFNFSLTCSWEYNAIRAIKAKGIPTKVVFEVNRNMPRVYGAPQHGNNELSIDFCDIIVEDDTPILDYPTAPATAVEQAIAENVAALIEDRATVQLGFGAIPMAIGRLLHERKELGIHTEMFCESHIDLIEAGSVTNEHKGLYDGVSVATFALGTKRLHNFLKENVDVAMLPVEEVNCPSRLARVNRMACVNSILTIDMTGQACAHCLGTQTYSGLGGAFEFASGSQLSPGGKSISCLPSTTTLKDGTVVSNIVAQHGEGTRITLPEHTIDWVVTEYGAVHLKPMVVEHRAAALISIAHPDFREGLAKQMRDAGMRLDKLSVIPRPRAECYVNTQIYSIQ